MAEFFRPQAKEKAVTALIQDTESLYSIAIDKRIKDAAWEHMLDNPRLMDILMNGREGMLFFLSQISTMVDSESAEKSFSHRSTVLERNNAFFKRLTRTGERLDFASTQKTSFFEPHSVCIEESEAYLDSFRDWDNGFLQKTRDAFGITHENERPYDLVVTNLYHEEFMEEYQASGFTTFNTRTGRPLICLPRGTDDNTLMHEYIHTQIRLFSGYGDLGIGFEEGFVESNVTEPHGYKSQRELFSFVEEVLPNTNMRLQESRNDLHARHDVFRSVVGEFGLNGLNYILRASADPERKAEKFYPRDMYDYTLKPIDVENALREINRLRRVRIALL